MRIYVVILMWIVGCGTAPETTTEQPLDAQTKTVAVPDSTPEIGAKTEPAPEHGGIKLLAVGMELPPCDDTTMGWTYYIIEIAEFHSCIESEWTYVDMRGTDGKNGLDGTNGIDGRDGVDGANGTDGLNGIDGVSGTDGTDGINGVDGSNGSDGVDGLNAKTLRLMSGNEYIGDVYSIDKVTNDYWTVNDDMRMEIDRSSGTFPYAYLVYAGLGCTGESRLVITNGYFANTFVKGSTGIVTRAIGSDMGVFAFQSRMAHSTNCADQSGSTNLSWDYDEIELPFAYPVSGPEIEN